MAFDEKQKGYCVREVDGKFLNNLVPVDQLCQVAKLADSKEVSWEVVKILNLRVLVQIKFLSCKKDPPRVWSVIF